MTKKELKEALMSGKKMTSDEFKNPDKEYCIYDEEWLGQSMFIDEEWLDQFRFIDKDGYSAPMRSSWGIKNWREVKEPSFEPKKRINNEKIL